MSIDLAKGSAKYLLARIITSVFIFFTIPILSRFMSQESIGLLMYFLAIIPLISVFIFLGSESALVRLFYEYKDKNKIVSNTFFIVLTLILFWTTLLYLININFDFDLKFFYNLTFLYVFFYGINNHLLSFFRVIESPNHYFVVVVLAGISYFFSQVSIGISLKDPFYVIISRIGVEFIVVAYAAYFFFKYIRFGLISVKEIKNILKYMLPIVPYTFALYAIHVTDKIFVEHFLGLNQMAIYGAAYTFVAVITIVSQSFDMAWGPYFYNNVSKKSTDHFNISINIFCGLLSIITIFIIIFSREIVSVIYPEQYSESYQILIILMVGVYVNAFFFFPVKSINYKRKNIYSALIAVVVMFINIALNYIFINVIGLQGCAIATLLSFCIFVALMTYAGEKVFPLNYEYFILLVFFGIVLFNAIFFYLADTNIMLKLLAFFLSSALTILILAKKYTKEVDIKI